MVLLAHSKSRNIHQVVKVLIENNINVDHTSNANTGHKAIEYLDRRADRIYKSGHVNCLNNASQQLEIIQ